MKTESTQIFLENVSIYARHGVSRQEREVGNTFMIDIIVDVDYERATETDSLTDTVSYADIYQILTEEMAIPSKLLEHVCGRMVRRLFQDIPQINEIELKLSKKNPPMGADITHAGVKMKCRRDIDY